jgi:Ca2+-dependent lipid-binding protein
VHHLRRNKLTLKIEANFIYILFIILGSAILSVLFPPIIFSAPLLLILFAFCYMYEEYFVQKKLIKELNGNVKEILHKETVEENAWISQ